MTDLRTALEASAEGHGPGLFGLVTDGGEVVFAGSVGVADLADPRPMTADDQVRVGSITKTYVAALVLQLAAEGVLGLSETVEQWVPGGEDVTVELLLRMRSGLPDYISRLYGDPPDLRVLERYWSPETLVRLALEEPDRLPPGAVHRYSNTDYVLLGLVVERATGERVDAQLWQRLFEPLGLHDTTFPTVDPRLRGPHARGHVRSAPPEPYVECTTLSPSDGWTAGAVVTTPRDLARFFDALLGGHVLDPESLALMTECREVLSPTASRGLGLVRYAYPDGTVAYGQHGGTPGYTTVVQRSTSGRCVVLAQNGIDSAAPLFSSTPFVTTALTT